MPRLRRNVAEPGVVEPMLRRAGQLPEDGASAAAFIETYGSGKVRTLHSRPDLAQGAGRVWAPSSKDLSAAWRPARRGRRRRRRGPQRSDVQACDPGDKRGAFPSALAAERGREAARCADRRASDAQISLRISATTASIERHRRHSDSVIR
jgi:hypothetical protein